MPALGVSFGRPVTQPKDHKSDHPGPSKIAPKTLVGVPQMPSSRPPRASSQPPRPTGQSLSSGPAGRFAAPPASRGPAKTARPSQETPPVEEISSSLLLPDEPASAATIPGLEELSGSLLLDDPSLVLDDPTVVQQAQPAPPAAEPVAAPPPAAHRALLGLPELPHRRRRQCFDGQSMALPPSKATLRPPMTAPAGQAQGAQAQGAQTQGAQAQARDTEPHEIPASSPVAAAADTTDGVPPPPEHMFEALHGFEAAQGFEPGPGTDADGTTQYEAAPSPSTAPVQGDVEVNALPRGGLIAATDAMKRVLGSLKAALAESTSATEPRRRGFFQPSRSRAFSSASRWSLSSCR